MNGEYSLNTVTQNICAKIVPLDEAPTAYLPTDATVYQTGKFSERTEQ